MSFTCIFIRFFITFTTSCLLKEIVKCALHFFPVFAVFFFWTKYLIFVLAIGGSLSSLYIIISHIYIKTQPNYDSRTYFSVHPNCHHQMKFRYKNQMQNLIQKFITLCLMNTFFLFPFVLENILS